MTENKKTGLFWLVAVLMLLITVGICIVMSPPFITYVEYADTEATLPTVAVYNINTATVDQLADVYGFDRPIAFEIVSYRETYGSFSAVEDLLKVPGITEHHLWKASGFLECY